MTGELIFKFHVIKMSRLDRRLNHEERIIAGVGDVHGKPLYINYWLPVKHGELKIPPSSEATKIEKLEDIKLRKWSG